MLKIFRPKNFLKLVWFGFGSFGVFILAKQYLPNMFHQLNNSNLVKGVQSALIRQLPSSNYSSSDQISINDLKNLDPQTSTQVVSEVIGQELKAVAQQATEQIVQFPAKQIRKIKIGACEELLEEDICSVASQLNCPSQ